MSTARNHPRFTIKTTKADSPNLKTLQADTFLSMFGQLGGGPCLKQFPFLEKLEQTYKDKNIVFVSISIDSPEDAEKWNTFVAAKNLSGVQLMADKAHQSEFILNYGIVSIPRFIIISPNGIIVDANAKMPSDPALIEQLDGLLK